jgi:hypothetical protein
VKKRNQLERDKCDSKIINSKRIDALFKIVDYDLMGFELSGVLFFLL